MDDEDTSEPQKQIKLEFGDRLLNRYMTMPTDTF